MNKLKAPINPIKIGFSIILTGCSVFFLSAPRVFAQSGGVLVSPPASADQDDTGGSTEVLDASDQGGSGDHGRHKHQHADDNSDASPPQPQIAQSPDLYLFGGEYDSDHEARNNSHRGSESREVAHSAGSPQTVRDKDDGNKKGDKK